jgi:hypothetical protein
MRRSVADYCSAAYTRVNLTSPLRDKFRGLRGFPFETGDWQRRSIGALTQLHYMTEFVGQHPAFAWRIIRQLWSVNENVTWQGKRIHTLSLSQLVTISVGVYPNVRKAVAETRL